MKKTKLAFSKVPHYDEWDQQLWRDGLPVRVTEYLGGQEIMFSIVPNGADWKYQVGDHDGVEITEHSYWKYLDSNMMNLLNHICVGEKSVQVYGVVVGTDPLLDYSKRDSPKVFVHDIKVDGYYIPWDLMLSYCDWAKVRMVPLFYEGIFSPCLIDEFKTGGSKVANPNLYRSLFKERMGIVITATPESLSLKDASRVICKVVNPNFQSLLGELIG